MPQSNFASHSSAERPVLVWLRQDLRLADHPALSAACETGQPVILVFILPDQSSSWNLGGASRWWLHESLKAFQEKLEKQKQTLLLRTGEADEILPELVRTVDAAQVVWNRRYEPAEHELDEKVQIALNRQEISWKSFKGSLLLEPWELKTQSGGPYQVYSPFWRAALNRKEFEKPLPAPKAIRASTTVPDSLTLDELKLEPKIDWAGGLAGTWEPGEAGAQKLLQKFLKQGVESYRNHRNFPAIEGTSRLSPHLHFGEITPRQIVFEVQQLRHNPPKKQHKLLFKILKIDEKSEFDVQVGCYLQEIGWREFAYHILHHFPHTTEHPLRENFRQFRWEHSPEKLKAWQQGQTGFPIVDAGMRELWHTGWMHNRGRMIVASFLTKDLLIPWQEGARWFWDTLVDADLANNTMGWQWTAGCGADAAPYFRVFNPKLQSEKFDSKGEYIRQWCPELAKLPTKYLHEPSSAPNRELEKAGVVLGKNYPLPIVNHAEQRDRALQKWEEIK